MTEVPTIADAVVLAPTDRFFLQAVALDPAASAAEQVALALEGASPFPLTQMYHGFVAAPDGRQALAFASYRRRFTAEEQAGWPEAVAVVPAVVACLGPQPSRPEIVVHVDDGALQAVAWDGKSALPVAWRALAATENVNAQLAALVAELQRDAGLADAEVRHVSGPIGAGADDDGDLVFRVGGQESFRLPTAAVGDADVRDKSFLEEKKVRESQDRRWWGGAVATAALLGLAALLEAGHVGLLVWNRRERAALAEHAEEARQIEAAQTMSLRIEQLSERQQRPLEWLSAVGAARPRSVQFTRVVAHSDRTIEIEAQTGNANDVGNFEAALRQLPVLASVEVRDLRAREGMTSFVVALAFKPAAGGAGVEGQP